MIQRHRINAYKILALALVLAGCTLNQEVSHRQLMPAHSRYVAMGSSFAAGPDISTVDDVKSRCGRSIDNYAHQLARKNDLQLVDVSCGGATTANVLGKWAELPPQLEAVTPDTRLVTITIGGNDIGYIGCLISASVAYRKNPSIAGSNWRCPIAANTAEAAWQQLEASMRSIAAQVKARAPAARLIFIDYPVVLPEQGGCPAAPLSDEQAGAMRVTAKRLAEITAAVARDSKAELLTASVLSKGHDACAAEPWMNGFMRSGEKSMGAAYHPNIAGMTAIATALDKMLAH